MGMEVDGTKQNRAEQKKELGKARASARQNRTDQYESQDMGSGPSVTRKAIRWCGAWIQMQAPGLAWLTFQLVHAAGVPLPAPPPPCVAVQASLVPPKLLKPFHPCTKSVPCGPPSQLATAAVHLIFSRAALATAMALSCSACLDCALTLLGLNPPQQPGETPMPAGFAHAGRMMGVWDGIAGLWRLSRWSAEEPGKTGAFRGMTSASMQSTDKTPDTRHIKHRGTSSIETG
ncbi:hypothetical protein CFAM422_003925 [Trichoderma lentiforme]|uniref:Uncharacterized protein n=1 Tax=Trichoderma lentiforme TaxID=1567552 RepID=A0A9P4XJK1_9HYPO|nr:hypothetical protein CFAM422_003925 [Trichoderma lentiforme]